MLQELKQYQDFLVRNVITQDSLLDFFEELSFNKTPNDSNVVRFNKRIDIELRDQYTQGKLSPQDLTPIKEAIEFLQEFALIKLLSDSQYVKIQTDCIVDSIANMPIHNESSIPVFYDRYDIDQNSEPFYLGYSKAINSFLVSNPFVKNFITINPSKRIDNTSRLPYLNKIIKVTSTEIGKFVNYVGENPNRVPMTWIRTSTMDENSIPDITQLGLCFKFILNPSTYKIINVKPTTNSNH